MQPIQLIETFINFWNQRDFDSVMSLLSDDIEYHNIPMPILRGKIAVRDFIRPFENVKEIEWVTHHITSNNEVVMTERTDTFVFPNGKTLSLPVMGIFHIQSELITKWRDYFDMLDFQQQMAALED
tara:strand:+ start:492 stop:869 length:378 start_codon:yes stop_codon:yes gene_type:complete